MDVELYDIRFQRNGCYRRSSGYWGWGNADIRAHNGSFDSYPLFGTDSCQRYASCRRPWPWNNRNNLWSNGAKWNDNLRERFAEPNVHGCSSGGQSDYSELYSERMGNWNGING